MPLWGTTNHENSPLPHPPPREGGKGWGWTKIIFELILFMFKFFGRTDFLVFRFNQAYSEIN